MISKDSAHSPRRAGCEARNSTGSSHVIQHRSKIYYLQWLDEVVYYEQCRHVFDKSRFARTPCFLYVLFSFIVIIIVVLQLFLLLRSLLVALLQNLLSAGRRSIADSLFSSECRKTLMEHPLHCLLNRLIKQEW
jgi:Ni/Fe-hydrogenase subunit HybB-like protein